MGLVKIHRNIAVLKGIDLFYMDTRTEGPAILCLHGRMGRAETWHDFMRHAGHRYRIIAPDQRGHGLSGKPLSTYTAEEMAADTMALLEYLKIDSVMLMGHSMGGRIAGYAAALYPEFVQALMILDKSASGSSRAQDTPRDSIPSVNPLTKDWPLPFASRNEAHEFFHQIARSDLEFEYYINSLFETVEGHRMMFSSQAMAANIHFDQDWFHVLPEIKCPVLMIRAQGSGAVSDEDWESMRSLIADCETCEVAHPDHNVHLGDKAGFYEHVDRFLSRISSSPRSDRTPVGSQAP